MPSWRSSPGSKAGTTRNRIITGFGMLSPDEYEAAFYADTTNANLTPSSKLETANRASNEPGDPHCVRGRLSDRRQPASAAADQPGPVGVSGRVERVPRFVADRGCGTEPVAASGPVGGCAPFHADRGGGVAHPRRC